MATYLVANTYIIMPLCGPTGKIARFQLKLKFIGGTKCGNKKQKQAVAELGQTQVIDEVVVKDRS